MRKSEARGRFVSRQIPLLVLAPVIVTVLAALFVAWAGEQTMSRATDRTLAEHTATIKAACEQTGRDPGQLEALLARVRANDPRVEIALFDPDLNLLGGTGNVDGADLAPVLRRVIETGRSESIEVNGDRDLIVHIERVAFDVGARPARAVVVAHSRSEENREIAVTMASVLGLAAIVVTLAALISLRLSRKLGQRLFEIVEASEAVAAGDLGRRVDESRLIEVEHLARAFNSMVAALEVARAEITQAAQARAILEQRFRHVEALAIVGQVASSFAHEIGSPLNTILGWGRLGEGDEANSAEARESFRTIVVQCERIQRIVEKMLQVARPAADDRTDVDLVSVAREVAAFLRPEADSQRVRIDVVAPSPVIVRAARDQLLEVAMNLVINALHAQPNGGKVRMTVADSKEGPRLEVADAGSGIPAELHAQVWEPFYTTKTDPNRRGTGLGLPIVSQIVRDLGGKVILGASPEGGASFVIQLPPP